MQMLVYISVAVSFPKTGLCFCFNVLTYSIVHSIFLVRMRAGFFTEGAKVLKFSLRGPLDEKNRDTEREGGKR